MSKNGTRRNNVCDRKHRAGCNFGERQLIGILQRTRIFTPANIPTGSRGGGGGEGCYDRGV